MRTKNKSFGQPSCSCVKCKNDLIMPNSNIIIQVGDKEMIGRALKRFRSKLESIGIIRKLKDNVRYKKPSIRRRDEKKKSIYRHKMNSSL